MRKFKVIALSLGGIGKVFKVKDIVTEKNFPAGNIPDLIDKEFIEEIDGETETAEAPKSEAPKKDAPVQNSDFSKKEIDIALDHLNIEYKLSDKKDVHCALLPVSDSTIELLESIKAGTYVVSSEDSDDDDDYDV